MDNRILVPAKTSGFVMVMSEGAIFLKADTSVFSPSVGGEEWDVVELLKLSPGERELPAHSKWEVRREDEETLTFEMIDKKSEVQWLIPLLLTVKRQDLLTAAKTFCLV